MEQLKIVDMTLRECETVSGIRLSFKERLEIAKLLERLRVDVIETGYISDSQADTVFVRTLASTIQNSVISCPVALDEQAIERTWQVLSQAKHPRLNLVVPISSVQMEYSYQMKADRMQARTQELLTKCVALCPDVEFTAEDAVRSEHDYLLRMIQLAIESGARTITLVDSGGQLLPWEMTDFITSLRQEIAALSQVQLSIQCKNDLGMASACALAAVAAGANQLKATFNGLGLPHGNLSLEQLSHALQLRNDALNAPCRLNMTEIQRICKQLESLTGMNRNSRSAFGHVLPKPETEHEGDQAQLTADADLLTVRRHIQTLGYDLEEADMEAVYRQFQRLIAKKRVDDRDLDALVAETARQVAPTYQLINYVINSGNMITATAVLRVDKCGVTEQSVSLGDGPIDAAFLAIEQMLGHHFDLEDFHIQAVTEGREAMGDALVKLRHNGRLYSGRGLSTDIIGASIRAYLNAVNKIVYEEKVI